MNASGVAAGRAEALRSAPARPIHVLPYAYAVKPDDAAWLKRDGRLAAAAKRNVLTEIVDLR